MPISCLLPLGSRMVQAAPKNPAKKGWMVCQWVERFVQVHSVPRMVATNKDMAVIDLQN